ncbi:MAG: FixH family protein [Wenzhouxiangellaceae bacterium]|nr:FixH family protein [Wenzhouxiangellaceae bacterium]
MSTPEPSAPWYRQFFPWLLIAILGWGIVSSLITLSVAVGNPPQMMTGDYQRLGKVLVDTHQRADRAEALGLAGELTLAAGRWTLVLDSHEALEGDALLLLIQHPADAGRDRQLLLRREDASRWTAIDTDFALPARGRMIVTDPAQTWWVSGAWETGSETAVALRLRPERL